MGKRESVSTLLTLERSWGREVKEQKEKLVRVGYVFVLWQNQAALNGQPARNSVTIKQSSERAG